MLDDFPQLAPFGSELGLPRDLVQTENLFLRFAEVRLKHFKPLAEGLQLDLAEVRTDEPEALMQGPLGYLELLQFGRERPKEHLNCRKSPRFGLIP